MDKFKVKRGEESKLPVEKSNDTLYHTTDTKKTFIGDTELQNKVLDNYVISDKTGTDLKVENTDDIETAFGKVEKSIDSINNGVTTLEVEEEIWCSDEASEETEETSGEIYAKIGPYGVKAKAFYDMEGNKVDTTGTDVSKRILNDEIYRTINRISPYIGFTKTTTSSDGAITHVPDMVFVQTPDMHVCYDFMVKNILPLFVNTDNFNNQGNIIISCGDMLFDGSFTKTIDNLINEDNYIPSYKRMINEFANNNVAFLGGIGGHDFNNYDRVGNRDYSIANNFTKAQQRQYFIQPCLDAIENNSVLKNKLTYSIPEDTNACYYYVENNATGHRVIILDECDHPQTSADGTNYDYDTYSTVCYSQAQLEWLIEALKTTKGDRYVIVNTHVGMNVSSSNDIGGSLQAVKDILSAYANKTTYAGGNGSDARGFSWTLDSVDFSECGGVFGAVFKGHTHNHENNYIFNGVTQICSANPDNYPYRSGVYAYKNNYSADIYVIRDKEIRNFHFGRTAELVNSTNKWEYNKLGDRFVETPVTIN